MSAWLGYDIYQRGAAFLRHHFQSTLKRWAQRACFLHRPLGVDAKASRHRSKIYRWLSQARADAFIGDWPPTDTRHLLSMLLRVVEAAIIVHDHEQGDLVMGGCPERTGGGKQITIRLEIDAQPT